MENPAFEDIKLEFDKSTIKQEKVFSFEEAIALTKIGKFHYFLLLVSGLCFMTVMVETMGISLILPYLKCDLESTISEQGFLASSGFLGIVLSSHSMGFLADTWGRVKTLRTALVFSFATTVISAFSINIWMLIVFRFFNGFFISGCQACVFSFLGEFHGQKTRVRYVTLLSMFLPIGLMFLPAMAIVIMPFRFNISLLGMQFRSWRILLLSNSFLTLFTLSGLFFIPESPKYDLIQGRTENAIKTFQKIFRLNTGKLEDEYPVKDVYIEMSGASLSNIHGVKGAFMLVWKQTLPLFYKERIFHTLNICCIMFIVFAIAQGTFMWFPTMLNLLIAKSSNENLLCEIIEMYDTSSRNNSNTSSANNYCEGPVDIAMFQILSIIGIGFTIIYLVFSFIINKVGRKNLLFAWLCVVATCCLTIHWIHSFVLSIILLTLIMGIGNCGGIVSSISIEFFPTNINAMAMCLIMMMGRLGAVAGSNFVGMVIFRNCDLLFYIYVGVIIVIGMFSIFLPKTSKNIIVQPSKARTENNLNDQ